MTTIPALDPRDLLTLATNLYSGTDSASIRSSCDRAYYAAFLYAREELSTKGYYTPSYRSNDHKDLPPTIRRLQGGMGIGNELRLLRNSRNTYNYTTGAFPTSTSGANTTRPPQWMLTAAANVIQYVEQLP
ncbi:MAG: hypothetical protein MN733_20870 [Nitrososphaera sp.]|nr:hypothetical protein [Nitrososphaera sp.]